MGNAGFLPQLNLNAAATFATNDTKQEYSNGPPVNKEGVESNNINSAVGLSWTLFDGFKMFATRNKLKELEAMGELNLKMQVETSIAQLINAYYAIVMQKQLLKAMSEEIGISEERLKITEKKAEIGSASKVDLLQAKVDKNEQQSILLKQKTILNQNKAELNQLLSRPAETGFDVADTIAINYNPVFNDLKSNVDKQNTSLLMAQRSVNVANYSLQEIGSQRYPKLAFLSNYVFSRAENQAGFTLLNQNLGWNYGLTLTMPLFNGFNLNNQYKNAKLSLLNSNFEYKNTQLQVDVDLVKTYRQFKDNLETLALEEENIKLAKENVAIALELFRLGTTNFLTLKEAQKSYEDAMNRLVTARYNAKISETELMRLNSVLVK